MAKIYPLMDTINVMWLLSCAVFRPLKDRWFTRVFLAVVLFRCSAYSGSALPRKPRAREKAAHLGRGVVVPICYLIGLKWCHQFWPGGVRGEPYSTWSRAGRYRFCHLIGLQCCHQRFAQLCAKVLRFSTIEPARPGWISPPSNFAKCNWSKTGHVVKSCFDRRESKPL